jgi:O-antigen/teichoic acid export membrane protein
LTNTFRKYFKIISEGRYVLLLNLTDKLFSFIILVLLARNFKTDIYGEIVTLITLSTVFATIFDFGLPLFLQREISLKASERSRTFSNVFIVSVALFIGYILFSLAYFKIFYSEISIALFIIIAVMMYISSLVTICYKALSGINDFKNQFISFSLPRILILILFTAGLYYLSFTIEQLMLVMLTGFAVNLILALLYLKKSEISFSFRYFSLKHVKAVLKISVPLGLAVIFNMLYDKVDVLLISKLKDFTEVAFYNAGYGIYKTGALTFSFLLVPGFTKISSMGRNKNDINDFFRKYFITIICICIITSLILFFLADPVISLIYTGKFTGSAAVLKILCFALIPLGLNNLTGVIINGMGYFKIVMYITLCALILNIALNAFLIPKYGITAAGIVTVITECFIFLTEYYYFRKIMRKRK